MTQAPSDILSDIRRGGLCSGCGGCALVAPEKVTMSVTGHGFLRPRQNAPLSAAQSRAIAAICPGLGQSVDAGGRPDDPLWGPYLEMRTGWSTDPALRHQASSGGALSALLVELVHSGTVDGVVQIAADPDRPEGNVTVLSRTADEIREASGSRYAPSSPLAGLNAYLDGNERLAFVGKPCDVAALRALEHSDPRIAAVFPVKVSFFCAGVPSLKGAEAVLEALGAKPDKVDAFRYRGMGWPGMATATLKDGQTRSMTYQDSWGGILSAVVQHRCKVCADGTGVAADIACADAWAADDQGYPVFDDQPGISLIVARTETGRALLAAAEASGRLETQAFDPAGLAGIQPGQRGRRQVLVARLAGLMLLARPRPRYRGLLVRAAARGVPVRLLLRNMLGMVRRGLQGRIREVWDWENARDQ